MMMMMIMIAEFVESIRTPIKTWLDMVVNCHDHHKATTSMVVKEVGVGSSPVDCIVCLSEVALGERIAMLERCRHGFHVECVEAWLKDHPNCPLCRTPLSGEDEDTHKKSVYLKKLYEMMVCYGCRVVETMAGWLTTRLARVCAPAFLRAAVICDVARQDTYTLEARRIRNWYIGFWSPRHIYN